MDVPIGPGCRQGWNDLGFLEKGFLGFFRFQCSLQIRPDTKFPPRKNILYTILSVTLFAVNYNKTHKSQLKYEIKYDLYKLWPKNFKKN